MHPDCESALMPVSHDAENSASVSPACNITESESSYEDQADNCVYTNERYEPEFEKGKSHFLLSSQTSQTDLDDQVKDMSLMKQKSELLTLRLKENNLLQIYATTSLFCDRHAKFASYCTPSCEHISCSFLLNTK